MPEYVYALHDFLPEHEDEVSFSAGERIEVIERDDQFGDGWWQGRNLAGKVGLFPQSYTTPAPPVTQDTETSLSGVNGDSAPSSRQALQTLTEESETESPIHSTIVSPVPKPPPATFLNGTDSELETETETLEAQAAAGDGEMMKATLTDVQKAIEQLGRNRVDGDGGRSFSFASTRDGGTESETDFDLSDIDNQDDIGAQGEDWHKGARRKLAEKARKAVEEAQRLEAMMASGSGERRSTAPPINVELSDESEDEGDHPEPDRTDFTTASSSRTHPHIPEEDEEELMPSLTNFENKKQLPEHQQEASATTTSTITPQLATEQLTPPDVQETVTARQEDIGLPTATRETFSEGHAPVPVPPAPVSALSGPLDTFANGGPVFSPPPLAQSVSLVEKSHPSVPPIDTKRNSAPTPSTQPLSGHPSPTISSHTSGYGLATAFQGTSVSSVSHSISTNPTSAAPTQGTVEEKKEKKHPNDWSVEEVIEWLKSRGFDQDVCDKFTEQEITGDVLLELDVNVLKTEIGILAFGKRMRIANAISELRRPPSVSSFEPHHEVHTPSSMIHQPIVHSRTQSVSQSHHSFPGTPLYSHAQSVHSSLGSPVAYHPPTNGQLPTTAEGQTNGNTIAAAIATSAGVGLGIGVAESNSKMPKGRPSQLMLSPSDGALKDKVIVEAPLIQTPDEDRAHMSEGEVIASSTSVRRRLFGRSHDSSLSVGVTKDKDSSEKDREKESSSPNTVGTRHRSKRSMDGKSSDHRLSIFGSTFGGSLSKGRKPPPSEDSVSDSKSSMFSRLGGSSVRKTSSQRPSTPGTSPKTSVSEAKEKGRSTSSSAAFARPSDPIDERPVMVEKPVPERATLRKRASSGPTAALNAPVPAPEATGEIQPGQSILEQVGEPDHIGWMRKKAVRYNTWKTRYFVLKGEHLYILRSNNRSETRLKGYINIHGYRVTVDETLDPGKYCFRIDHDQDKTHYFSSDEKTVIREWMKAIMKATIGRDYTKPVVSSCNIPTIPLVVAQAMNPAPRPPSPSARAATQKALRRENPNQLSSRDARILMGLPGSAGGGVEERKGVQTFFADEAALETPSAVTTPKAATAPAPPRPSREMRRMNSTRSTINSAAEESLIDWANSHLPESLQVHDTFGPLFNGLALLRIAESVKGKPASPPVPDSAFPTDPADDKLDGLFRLFDFLLDNDVKMGSVSINDIRQGKRDKILQMTKALKAWEDKRRALAMSMGSSVQAGSFMAPVTYGF
ncbi:hypothetical protein EST38_g391 [Candolleomyces aberdarensis]|uniref:Uncharacterized protein n=1 Tax=Candolleomyces aberdarensis TaxID=2316362 RepID=A0A4Q2DZH2_9AGAR|nr:hypothetical protein EST38_g391 [Candolleomyces aberdarensis]